jgi:hypothetical protein
VPRLGVGCGNIQGQRSLPKILGITIALKLTQYPDAR